MDFGKLMATQAGWGVAILRVVTGIIFIAHGLPKLGLMGGPGVERTAQFFANVGIPFPELSVWLTILAEAVGGALLIVGFLTRFAAFTQVIAMLVAVFVVHWPNGLTGDGGYEWALLMAAASACLLFEGAGKASIDRAFGGSDLR